MDPREDRVSDLVPFVHVADLQRSITFYELLGFEVRDTYEVDGELNWVALQHAHARIMLQLASAPIDPHQQAILFYLYAEDLDGLRDHLLSHGLRVGPIRDGSPGPEREMKIGDPDGYCLMIAESEGERSSHSEPPRREPRGEAPNLPACFGCFAPATAALRLELRWRVGDSGSSANRTVTAGASGALGSPERPRPTDRETTARQLAGPESHVGPDRAGEAAGPRSTLPRSDQAPDEPPRPGPRVNDPLRRRPPERTLRWVEGSIGQGSRLASLRRLTLGGWHANHALTVIDRHETAHRLVLRRWARPEWAIEDPDFTAAREAAVLELLAESPVPAPRLVAADPDGKVCDVPTLLITRLPGGPPGLPGDMEAFLAQLAKALTKIHSIDGPALARMPAYRNYYDLRCAEAPTWSGRPELWERALELGRSDPPEGGRCFIHRDYHPENTLWSRGRLTGTVDWTSASFGPAAVDTGHMRWNLALTYGLDAADEFLRQYRSLTGDLLDDQPYWDIITVLDLACDLDPDDWSDFDLRRLERYLEAVLELGA